ncbi:MAG: phosphodiester glycosidase family protein, partial [Armatimonadota bacterium]
FIVASVWLIAVWWHCRTSAVPNWQHHNTRSLLKVKVAGGLGLRNVALVEVSDASQLGVWLGEELRGKRRMGDHALSVARTMDARVVLTASFHWWTGSGFLVLGHVVSDGENLVSPNPELLHLNRCYFAVTWDGRFLIGETNLTTGKLLQKFPRIRHLVGGGGWLIKDGDPEAWRLAFKQGFRSDIMNSRRERTVVAIDEEGETAWLAVFDGQVSLRETSWWLKRHLPVRHAIFFDGGRNSVLVVRSPNEELQIYGTPKPLPEVPCMLIVR